jgi:Mg2+ and Co2+ transporter CorA
LRDDASIFLQLRNSINSKVIALIDQCEYEKESMDYLEFLHSGKVNISRIYDVRKNFYYTKQLDQSLTAYLMHFKRTYEELHVLLLFNPNIKVIRILLSNMAHPKKGDGKQRHILWLLGKHQDTREFKVESKSINL